MFADVYSYENELLYTGRQEGSTDRAIENARNFLKMGLSSEQVAERTGLSLGEIMQLKVQM